MLGNPPVFNSWFIHPRHTNIKLDMQSPRTHEDHNRQHHCHKQSSMYSSMVSSALHRLPDHRRLPSPATSSCAEVQPQAMTLPCLFCRSSHTP